MQVNWFERQMQISEEMRHFCYERIDELAKAYKDVLRRGLEYEAGFYVVMAMLDVAWEEVGGGQVTS